MAEHDDRKNADGARVEDASTRLLDDAALDEALAMLDAPKASATLQRAMLADFDACTEGRAPTIKDAQAIAGAPVAGGVIAAIAGLISGALSAPIVKRLGPAGGLGGLAAAGFLAGAASVGASVAAQDNSSEEYFANAMDATLGSASYADYWEAAAWAEE